MSDALLAGRRGLVLGVSSENSIGYACVRAMREQGAEVAATYRPSRATSCGPLLEAAGCTLHLGVDAEEEASIAAAFTRLTEAWGRLDFLVHTWMHVPKGALERPLLELPKASFDQVLDVGAHSLIVASRHAVPLLRASAAPRIVALTSASRHLMTPHYHVAGIAKAALEATMLYLAYELGPLGILCNSVSSSLVETSGAVATVGADNASKTRALLAKKAPTRQPVTLDEIAAQVVWLSSAHLRNVTGETLTVDGGYARGYF